MKAFYRLFYYFSILLTGVLAGVTLVGAFAGNTAPESFKLIPFIGLGLPVLLLANLAFAIYWTIRWRCWVFLSLIALFGNWGYISCVLQFPLFSPASEPRTHGVFLQRYCYSNAESASGYPLLAGGRYQFLI